MLKEIDDFKGYFISDDGGALNGAAEYEAYYRENPDIFCEEYLGIRLRLFQRLMLVMMFHFGVQQRRTPLKRQKKDTLLETNTEDTKVTTST